MVAVGVRVIVNVIVCVLVGRDMVLVVVNVIVEVAVTVWVIVALKIGEAVALAMITVFVGTRVGVEVLVAVAAEVLVAVKISSGPSGRTLVFFEHENMTDIKSAIIAADSKKFLFISSTFFSAALKPLK